MDVKDAVARAKSYLADSVGDEEVRDLGLEEIRYDDSDEAWLITLGYSRPWDAPKIVTTVSGKDLDLNRTYKVVRLSDGNGALLSVKDRFLEMAEG